MNLRISPSQVKSINLKIILDIYDFIPNNIFMTDDLENTEDLDDFVRNNPKTVFDQLSHQQLEYVAARMVEIFEAAKPDHYQTWKFDPLLNEASLSRLADEMESALQKSGHAGDMLSRQADLLDTVFTRMTLLGMQSYGGERFTCEKLRAAMLAQRLCGVAVDRLHKYDPNHAKIRKMPERTE